TLFNPPDMRAAIDAQLRQRRLPVPRTAAGYARLICESLGAGHATAMRRFQELSGRRFARILMVGGGAKNSLLAQATADAAQVPVHALALEGSATGNIASQLIALGAVKDLAQFRAAIATQFRPTIYTPSATG
ncbi:MAG TPA: FGGY-family carbohydrate kinase, partial [Acidobacteriota bacterium]|nr:FGGY-family carbohydrate kinase [Acidobacteriota bacterium]